MSSSKILIAPDSFKECLSSPEVAAVLAAAVRERRPDAEVVECPLADGGEGTLDVLARALGAEIRETIVADPLGRPVPARYGVAGETAVLEVSQACGIQLLTQEERNPMVAHTQGVGELLLEGYGKGCRHFIVGLGGTVTCDGGAGMLSVPGVKAALRDSTVDLLCDVDTPFLGPQGAVRVFAPQKGAQMKDLDMLEERMTEVADHIRQETGTDVSYLKGAGAAGGLAGALIAYSNARYLPGAQFVMELTGFDAALRGVCLIITGEGKSDAQTLLGKVPCAVLRQARGIPVALLSGKIENRPALEQAGFHPIIEVSPRHLPLPEALQKDCVTANLQRAVGSFL